MTSYALSGDKEKLLAAGRNACIEKPIDPMLVVEQIEAVIAKEARSKETVIKAVVSKTKSSESKNENSNC